MRGTTSARNHGEKRGTEGSQAAALGLVLVAVLTAASLAGCAPDATNVLKPSGDAELSINPDISNLAPGDVVPNQYVVRFRAGVADVAGLAQSLVSASAGSIRYTYTAAIQGFAAALPAAAIDGIRSNPNVLSVEPDHVVTVGTSIQYNPPSWGMDRVDQRDLPLNSQYAYNYNGAGVYIYIIDTGILISHSDFGGRASVGYDALGGNGIDCNGHGTHVAGTAGGSAYGIAKGAQLVAVRVLDCYGYGTQASVIAGVDWVTGHHNARAVANMSLEGPPSPSEDAAVNNSIASGVTYTVAAGNDNSDACASSPQRVGPALTVGATTRSDSRASYSNFGTCLDLFAPGDSISSDWYTSNTATAMLSGTSMAAPHVAGMAAKLLQAHPSLTPYAVADSIVDLGTSGRLSNIGSGSPNLLLYSLIGQAPPPPPPLNVSISGPNTISRKGTYSWTASASGGSGGYTYSWSVDYDFGRHVPLGTAATQSLTVYQDDGNFTMAVTVTSGTAHAAASEYVYNCIGAGGDCVPMAPTSGE